VQKSTVAPLLTLGEQNISVNQCKYLEVVMDTKLSDDKVIQRPLQYQLCSKQLRASSRCSNVAKNVLLNYFCTLMYASQLWCNFRMSRMQRLRVTYNFGCRALCNLPWKASIISVAIRFNITFLPLRPSYEKISTCFLKDAEILTTYACML